MMSNQSIDLFVPGRVCLFGEHSDWAGAYRKTHPNIPTGQTIICGTNSGIYARVAYHPSKLMLHSSVDGTQFSAEIIADSTNLTKEASLGGLWSYIAGVTYQIKQKYDVGGIVIDNYLTDLPVQKGLSSSAAISVLTARAFNHVYGLGLSIEDEMEFAYLGEKTTPSQCGRMDQGCAFGQVPTRMTFDADSVAAEPIHVGADVHLVVVDLCAFKDTHRILADLNKCYPDTPSQEAADLRELLGATNHSIIRKAMYHLNQGDPRGLGELMTAAQLLFDCYASPACPTQLRAPVLHKLLNDKRVKRFAWGGKGVGSQGDGSAQFVARSQSDQDSLIQLINGELGMYAMPLTIAATDVTPDFGGTS